MAQQIAVSFGGPSHLSERLNTLNTSYLLCCCFVLLSRTICIPVQRSNNATSSTITYLYWGLFVEYVVMCSAISWLSLVIHKEQEKAVNRSLGEPKCLFAFYSWCYC